MPRATCRCGQRLSFAADGPDRVVCPTCSARIRVRRPDPAGTGAAAASNGAGPDETDGFIRFPCPCGRRLKVRAERPRPESGRCPDCGRVVPVPANAVPSRAPAPAGDPETPTVDMDAADYAELARWAETYKPKEGRASATARASTATAAPAGSHDEPPVLPPSDEPPAPSPVKVEAGLRVCPLCGRPVHLGAENCRQCGAHVPRR